LALESAESIVVEGGIDALSGRKVTNRIGYTIGTLYQLFDGMDDLVEQMNARTLAALYEHCRKGAEQTNVADQLRAFGILFIEFVKAHPNQWDAIMSYRFKPGHSPSDAYNDEIMRLFGLMEAATRQFYGPGEQADHGADMAVLWASLTGIFGVANSERQVAGLSLEQMLDRLIQMYLKARS